MGVVLNKQPSHAVGLHPTQDFTNYDNGDFNDDHTSPMSLHDQNKKDNDTVPPMPYAGATGYTPPTLVIKHQGFSKNSPNVLLCVVCREGLDAVPVHTEVQDMSNTGHVTSHGLHQRTHITLSDYTNCIWSNGDQIFVGGGLGCSSITVLTTEGHVTSKVNVPGEDIMCIQSGVYTDVGHIVVVRYRVGNYKLFLLEVDITKEMIHMLRNIVPTHNKNPSICFTHAVNMFGVLCHDKGSSYRIDIYSEDNLAQKITLNKSVAIEYENPSVWDDICSHHNLYIVYLYRSSAIYMFDMAGVKTSIVGKPGNPDLAGELWLPVSVIPFGERAVYVICATDGFIKSYNITYNKWTVVGKIGSDMIRAIVHQDSLVTIEEYNVIFSKIKNS